MATYTYDAWGKIRASTDTDPLEIGHVNPLRYRGYYYDTETGFYYLNSRYYNPTWGRFINADDEDVLTASPTALTDKNLFVYCDDNPVSRIDVEGDFWEEVAIAGAIIAGTGLVVASAGLLAPVFAGIIVSTSATVLFSGGITMAGIGVGIITTSVVGKTLTDNIVLKESYDPDPYKRKGQKKQGRENKNKNRKKDNYTPRNNKRNGKPAVPKKHTPAKPHQKYNPKTSQRNIMQWKRKWLE